MNRIIHSLVLCALLGPAWATVPSSISFQAYLTDRDGSPQEGSTLITFSIYTAEVGGSPQWWDTLNVDIESGLLSVELGRSANPFPADLFETPLWLGITVEADDEMIPRRALTAVGFSFKSEDANSVQGKSAAELDQSAHTDDLGNPHSVTAAQAGAADQDTLDAHTTETGNPHQTTAAQTGAADAAVFSSHVADASTHHSRYSDAESVAAVLAGDGPGSGLDADTLDGSEAATFSAGIDTNATDIASNASLIAANAQASVDNSTAIALISSAPALRAAGEVIGLVITTRPNGVWLLNPQNYMIAFNSESLELDSEELGFDQPGCEGQAYAVVTATNTANNGLARLAGWVLRAGAGGTDLFYGSPGSQVETFFQQSTLRLDGSCTTNSNNVSGVQVFPNDPAITGVSQYTFPQPITIGSQPQAFEIGDTGPAGGVVFSVTFSGLHGFEAAPTNQAADAEWGCDGTHINGADGVIVGTGAQNTLDIVADCAEPDIAARVAANYVLGGYGDWFLPSKDELYELYPQKDIVGGFTDGGYWSSSADDSLFAWIHYFTNGNHASNNKSARARVRAIRPF